MNKKKNHNWQIWIDTGGTFTDCLALDPTGKLHRAKVLSSSALRGTIKEVICPQKLCVNVKWSVPVNFVRGFQFSLLDTNHPEVRVEKYDPSPSIIELCKPLPDGISSGTAFEVRSSEEAPLLSARLVTSTPMGSPLPRMAMRLATTRGTNALLERRGASIVLFITKGFGDLLQIGNQQRPDLFALDIRKPEPLYKAVVEVSERIAADGTILESLQLDKLADKVTRLVRVGIRVAAIAFMHSYVNPEHERRLAEYLLKNGFHHVSCSSDLAPFIKILPRAETAVVDAYLSPVIDDYLDRVQTPLKSHEYHHSWDLSGAVEDAQFAFLVGLKIANQDQLPQWVPGDEFEKVRTQAQ